ncbi:MAG: DUF4240 domain-containing protein [Kofleriaceae bacterium]|nr:DUF4240 domain-containing protein [Kofleriaceae bacterium]
MDNDAFWKILDGCRRSDEPEEALARKLRRLAPAEVAAFDAQFRRAVERAFRWDLWGAAYLIEGGCSEDGFIYFLQGVLARGRSVYDKALVDADSLAAVDVEGNEEIGYVASEVYQELTGKQLRSVKWKRTKPTGKRWDFDDAAANAKHLPRLQRRAVREAAAFASASDSETSPAAPRAKGAASSKPPPRLLAQQDFVVLVDQGNRLFEQKKWARAVAIYAKTLAALGPTHDPRTPFIHGRLMDTEAARGRITRARQHYDDALRTRDLLDEGNAATRSDLDNQMACFLWLHGAEDELPQALAHARRAHDGATDIPVVRDTEMRILMRLGREKEARAIAKQVLREDPKQQYFQDVKKLWRL